MVDVASIIISVISLAGALVSAGIAGWLNFYTDERKRLSESEKVISKYRDPLLLAAIDLQSRFYNIADQYLLSYIHGSEDRKDTLLLYTPFVVGQFFSCGYILRRKAQFLRFSTDKDNKALANMLDKIQGVFGSDGYGALGASFMLWRGEQMAIGELMTVKDKEDGELYCMGYAAFKHKWVHDESFRGWFHSIETGIPVLARASSQHHSMIPDHRLRRLQHLLLDLTNILDPKRLQLGGSRIRYCVPGAPECDCSTCSPPRVQDSYEKTQVQRKEF